MRGGRSRAIIGLLTTALVLAAAINAYQAPFAQAGAALYPDLQTAPPSSLSIQKTRLADGKFHFLLRFDNTVENRGGRLEIVADLAKSRDLYQNIYDEEVGGNRVEQRRVMADLIFHPTHNHFHFSGFASYTLFKKADNGVFRNTSKHGNKTSFCILDSIKVDSTATNSPEYTECNAKRQGLSAGWGDIYTAALPDQWVDLGTTMAADGDYALHSTVDPLNRIKEVSDGNNTAVTLFTIKDGKLSAESASAPYCAAKPTKVQIGADVFVSCNRLPPGQTFAIRWRYEQLPPITESVSDGDGNLLATFKMPVSTRGGHYLFISSEDSNTSFRVSLIIIPTLKLNSTSGKVDQRVGFSLTGFSANTNVAVWYDQSPTTNIKLTTVTTDSGGNGSGSVVIPSSAAGTHVLSAIGPSSSDPATAGFKVKPGLELRPNNTVAGARVQIRMRGYGKNDSVVLKLKETGATLGTIRVSNTGAANPSAANSVNIPSGLKPGVYHVNGKGSGSGLSASTTLTITLVASTATPTRTPAPTRTATPIMTPTPTKTPISAEINTPQPTATPTIEPSPTVEPTSTPTESAPLQSDIPDGTPDT